MAGKKQDPFAILSVEEIRMLSVKRIPPSGIMVYCVLALHCRRSWSCHPSMPTILEKTGNAFSERALWSGIAALKAAGLLQQNHRRAKDRWFLPLRAPKK